MNSWCRRESVTPTFNGWLIVDCEFHGEIGRVPEGGNEFQAIEDLFTQHVFEAGRVSE